MREDEVGRPRSRWRWHPWFKGIFTAATHVSAASLLAAGMATSLAARKHKNRDDDRGVRDQHDRDQGGARNDRNRGDKRDNDPEDDRRLQRENRDRSDGNSDGGNNRGRKQDAQVDESSDAKSVESKQSHTATPTPEPDSDGGGSGRDGSGGGRGDGGGNDAGNAGSELFDSPLATKARRRAKDFENANRDDEDDGINVEIRPEGESVYETDTILFASGPEGVEVVTDNITFFAAPEPPPEPLPGLDLPVREPGYPFGEDFPFGAGTIFAGPTAAPEPTDPGDTAPAPAPPAEPIPAADEPAPASSDGGDNTMDFSS